MATSPITGDQPSAGFRRSPANFTDVPKRSISLHDKVIRSKDDADADILYAHPSVRIYHFQPPTDALSSLDKTAKTLPDADYPIDAIEILPWRSRTETLSARGKLVIEKVQGSVHFLKCGSVIHTIMRNSQCWCVDGESKFVMRIGRLRYQRIEMPAAEPEDKQKVEEFKEVIGKILKFEKTPCPFVRAFQVDLPEDAITPRRRGMWKRKEGLTPTTPDGEVSIDRKGKSMRTMSMRGMPPSSFPARSVTQAGLERPRTASTPTSYGRFSFPDIRSESPTTYTSGEEGTDSERHDSASDRAESSHDSDVDEYDKEPTIVPIIRSPLQNVQTLSPRRSEHHKPSQIETYQVVSSKNSPIVASRVQAINEFSTKTKEPALPQRRGSLPAKNLDDAGISLRNTLVGSIPEVPLETKEDEQVSMVPEMQPPQNARHERLVLDASDTNEPDTNLQFDQTRTPSKILKNTPPILTKNESTPEEVQDTDSTDTDSLYERLRAEVQREIEKPSLHYPPLQTVHAQGPELHQKDAVSDSKGPANSFSNAGIITPSQIALPQDSEEALFRTHTNDDGASTLSVDSFHTVLSDEDVDDLQPIHNTWGRNHFSHRRELSELTVTADTTQSSSNEVVSSDKTSDAEPFTPPAQDSVTEDDLWPRRRTPGAFDDEPEIRQRVRHQRSSSPVPPSHSSSSNVERTAKASQNEGIPAALLQRAATLAILKPLEVVVLLVHIFGRIAQGATVNDLLSGELFRRPGIRRTASGTFEHNRPGQMAGGQSAVQQDDFAMPLRRSQLTPAISSIKEDDAVSFGSID